MIGLVRFALLRHRSSATATSAFIFPSSFFCPALPPHFLTCPFCPANPDLKFRDFVPREPPKTIDSPGRFRKMKGMIDASACPSLVHAHAPRRRRPGRSGESRRRSARQRPPQSRPCRRRKAHAPRRPHRRAGSNVGPGRRPTGRAPSQGPGLEVSHAWDCVELGIDDPTDYDCLVLLGWPAGIKPRTGQADRTLLPRRRIAGRAAGDARGNPRLVELRRRSARRAATARPEMPFAGSRALRERPGIIPWFEGVETMIAEGEVY